MPTEFSGLSGWGVDWAGSAKDARIGSFDSPENRKWLMKNLDRLGHGLDERRAGMKRAMFLRSVLGDAATDRRNKPMKVDPVSTVDAYFLLVALMSGFGVLMETAAKRLEAA